MSQVILITGGAGFVGSGLAIGLKTKYPAYELIAFDNLKRRGSELNISRLKSAGVKFIHGDIRSMSDFEEVGEIDCLIDAAAEPSVLAGVKSGTDYLIKTNFNGTINSLEYAKRFSAKFVFLSTSRVYPIERIEKSSYEEGDTRFTLSADQNELGITEKGISEQLSLQGNRSLYGATKLASELFVNEYNSVFSMETVINRCGILTGPYQMGKVDQGAVVLWAARHFWKRPLAYIGYGGTGKQVRDMLHGNDLLRLIDWQIHNIGMVNGDTFNVGGGLQVSASLQEMTKICHEITGTTIEFTKDMTGRPGDIPWYITDYSLVHEKTGWKPEISVQEIFADIFAWLEKDQAALKSILN